ncbi:nucleotidyltransferase domain-containing protein [Agrobacterium fabrum]|nr:hypothetical protein At12D13_50620 [Agrobacterium fabrum]NTE63959.1 nucleotidyltransferase domain-containing protein [Agrobacterium fabrum]
MDLHRQLLKDWAAVDVSDIRRPEESDTLPARRSLAVDLVRKLDRVLQASGVRVMVIGSLAKGGFHAQSDIDLLVVECPRELKYVIEGTVEDCLTGLGGFRFDVVYENEIQDHRRERFLNGATAPADLGSW